MPTMVTILSRFSIRKNKGRPRGLPLCRLRPYTLLVQVYLLHLILVAIGKTIPPCAAGVAVVKPLGSLAGIVVPVQEGGISIVNRRAYEERNGAAGRGNGPADKSGKDKRAECRPRPCPAEHLRALGRRIREHYRILAEGRRIVRACHQEHEKHYPYEPRELRCPCGLCWRKKPSEYKDNTSEYLPYCRPVHAFAPPPLEKYRTGKSADEPADKRAKKGILQRVGPAVKTAVDNLYHHGERRRITGERTE